MKKIIVDLGFGIEKEIVVADNATTKDIQAACIAQTGQTCFCVKYSHPETPGKINAKYNEY